MRVTRFAMTGSFLFLLVFAAVGALLLVVQLHKPKAPDRAATCRYWSVLTPATEIGDTFWIGGWTRECDGLLGPVISFGSDETDGEVILRAEGQIAILDTQLMEARRKIGELEAEVDLLLLP